MRFPPALLLVGDEPWEMTFMDKLLLEIGWPGSQDTRGAVEIRGGSLAGHKPTVLFLSYRFWLVQLCSSLLATLNQNYGADRGSSVQKTWTEGRTLSLLMLRQPFSPRLILFIVLCMMLISFMSVISQLSAFSASSIALSLGHFSG